jgi:hypothetical protein
LTPKAEGAYICIFSLFTTSAAVPEIARFSRRHYATPRFVLVAFSIFAFAQVSPDECTADTFNRTASDGANYANHNNGQPKVQGA